MKEAVYLAASTALNTTPVIIVRLEVEQQLFRVIVLYWKCGTILSDQLFQNLVHYRLVRCSFFLRPVIISYKCQHVQVGCSL